MKAWIYQDSHQVEKRGADKASWYVGYLDPDGKRRCKSCGAGPDGQRNAQKFKKKVEAELLTGTYQSNAKKTWKEFRQDYESSILDGLARRTKEETITCLKHFERIINPVRMATISSQHIDDFIAERRKEPGQKKGSTPVAAGFSLRLHIAG